VSTVGLIGGGKMAEALIKGLISSKLFSEQDIAVSEIDPKRQDHLKNTFASIEITNDNQKVAEAGVVILAVKPQVLPNVVKDLSIAENQLVVSIAAGITLGSLEKAFPKVPVVRAMPNNPALVGAGITALSLGKVAQAAHGELAKKIFSSVGEVIMVEEKNMDAVTGLSGSGPAYVYLMIEAMTEAGRELGIEAKDAEKLAVQTVLGSAQTMQASGKSAKELREMVTSPGGTTLEGLKVLEKKKFVEAVKAAVKAAAERSKKLSK
jgi:pyrroline-5-carboxylate reductase